MKPTDIRTALTAAGIDAPGLDRAVELAELAGTLRWVNATETMTGLRDDIAAGTVTADQITARLRDAALDVVVEQQRHRLAADLDPAIAELASRSVLAVADAAFASLRARFDAAVAAIESHLEPIPADELPGGLHPHATHRVTADSDIDDARAELNIVRGARRALAAAGWGPRAEAWSWYVVRPADRPAAVLASSVWTSRQHDPFVALVEWRIPIRLNTPDETADTETAVAKKTSEVRIRGRVPVIR